MHAEAADEYLCHCVSVCVFVYRSIIHYTVYSQSHIHKYVAHVVDVRDGYVCNAEREISHNN